MSSSIYKWNFIPFQQDDKRVINSNELMEKRIEAINVRMQAESMELSSDFDASMMELGEVPQDGMEGEFGGSNIIKAHVDVETIQTQAKAEAEALLEEARAEAERIINEANAQVMAERNKVLSEAKHQGYVEGMEKVNKESERLQKEYREKERQLEAEYQKIVNELEPQFVDTITGIYEHIFHVELQSYREILVYLIAATIRKVENNRNFMVHVSKEDYPYVSMQKKQLAAGATSANVSIELVEDLTLSKNECLIETEGGIFDCSLGTQLAELGQKLRLLSYEKEK